MKRLMFFCFLLLFVTAAAQESLFKSHQDLSISNGLYPNFGESIQSSDTVTQKKKLNPFAKRKDVLQPQEQQLQQSNDIRNEWLKKGGKVYYVSVMLTGTYIGMDIEGVGKMNGYGGGYSFYMNSINLKMPEYKVGPSNWKSFNWGFGYDLVVYNFKFKMPETSGVKIDMNSTYLNIMITGNFGYTWGFGKYVDEATWKGVAITLKYKPSYNLSIVTSTITTTMAPIPPFFPGSTTATSNSESSGSFNAGGFGFDLDFNKFSATAEKLAPRPRTKFSFFMLPPIGDNPLFVSASIGVLFYPRQGGLFKRYR